MPSQVAGHPLFASELHTVGSGRRFRPRVALLLVAALLPLLGYVVLSAESTRQATLDWLTEEVRDATGQAANQEARALGQLGGLLHTIVRLPQFAADPPALCTAMQGLLAQAPSGITSMTLHWPDARLACSGALRDAPQHDSDIAEQVGMAELGASAVRGALAAAGKLVLSGQPGSGLLLSLMVPGPVGSPPAAVLSVGLSPQHMPAMTLPLRRDQTIRMLLDPDDGAVLAQLPQTALSAGPHVQSPRLLAAVRAGTGNGVVVLRDATGVQHLFGYAELPRSSASAAPPSVENPAPLSSEASAPLSGEAPAPPSGDIITRAVFLVGLPYDLLVAEADSRLHERWIAAAVMALFGGITAWMLANRTVLRPVADMLARRPGHTLSQNAALDAIRSALLWHGQPGNLAMVAEFTGEMVLRLDAKYRVVYASPASQVLLGFPPGTMVATDLAETPAWRECRAMLETLPTASIRRPTCRIALAGREGQHIWLEVKASQLVDGGFVLACRDVCHEQRLEQQLAELHMRVAELALEDMQTGLANRRRFDAALDERWRSARRAEEPLALVFVELDQWAAFTRLHGDERAAAGMRQMARIVAEVLRRPGDLAARYDGAMFAVLLPITDQIGLARVVHRLRDHCVTAMLADPTIVTSVRIGGCSLLPLAVDDNAQTFIDAARASLQRAYAADRSEPCSVDPAIAAPSPALPGLPVGASLLAAATQPHEAAVTGLGQAEAMPA